MNPSSVDQNQLPQRYRQRPRSQTWYAPVPGTTQHVYHPRLEDLQIPSSTIAVVPPQGLQSPTVPVQPQPNARPYTRTAIAMAPTKHRRQSYMSNASSGNSSIHTTPHSYGWSGGVTSDPMSIIEEHRLNPRTNVRARAMEVNAAGESRYFHVPPTQGFGRPVRQADPSLLTPENPDTKRKSHLLRETRPDKMEVRSSTQRYSSASSRTESSLNDRQSLPSQRARASTAPAVSQGYPVRRTAVRVAKSASSSSSRNDVSRSSVSRHRRTTSKDSATQTEERRPEQGSLDIHNNQAELPQISNKLTSLKHRSESREALQPAQILYRSSKPRQTPQANISKKIVKWASHSSYAPSVHYRTDSEGSTSSGLIEIPDFPSTIEEPKGIPRLRLLFEEDEDRKIDEEIDLSRAIVDPIDQEIAKASTNAIKHRRQGAVGVEVKRRASRISPPAASTRSDIHYPTHTEAGGLLGLQYSFPPSYSSRKGVQQDMNYGFRFPHHEGDVSDIHSLPTSAPPPHSDPSVEAATAFGKKHGHRRCKAPYDSKSSLPSLPRSEKSQRSSLAERSQKRMQSLRRKVSGMFKGRKATK